MMAATRWVVHRSPMKPYAAAGGGPVRDAYAVPLLQADFATGSLRQDSNVRPNRLFTADAKIILYRAGTLHAAKICVDR